MDRKIASAYNQAAAQLVELRDAYAQAGDTGGFKRKLVSKSLFKSPSHVASDRETVTMPPKPSQIDRDKLRAAVRKLGNESCSICWTTPSIFPPAKLRKLVKKYLDLKQLQPDAEQGTTPSLLTDVKRFQKASLAGEYYESFSANSKNYTDKSPGTCAWIAECQQ